MCSQLNSSSTSSSSSSLMVLPKCNLLSSRPFLNFQDGYQDSPQQNTQESQVTQNQEVHRQQDTQQQQQQQQDKKEENELFEDNVKDYSNNNSSVIPEVESGQGRVQHEDFTPAFEKDNTKKIPTSPKHVRSTIELMICPPAPKKKKTIQVTKRRLHHDHQDERVFLDVYNEVESLFPPSLLADLSKKIKKARKTTPIL
ncbi:hypothetical protein EJD97_010621 [Solanum chilense]|uniref:Uncharacterized protein n=1 Tax=Solanum chilense TaxID=4083 RepID=A0A6N2BJZ1_SOLCI|nr:hypothetical protein EJD97_010621 [Solanum chilense]